MFFPESDRLFHKGEELPVRFHKLPIQPAHRVILAIGIVISPMAEPEFIAADYHRRSLCRKQKQHGIFHLLQTQLQNGFLSCLSLRSAVPADIIGFPVTVFLAVGFIMLSVKRHQIGQRKAGIVRNIIDNARLFGIFLP